MLKLTLFLLLILSAKVFSENSYFLKEEIKIDIGEIYANYRVKFLIKRTKLSDLIIVSLPKSFPKNSQIKHNNKIIKFMSQKINLGTRKTEKIEISFRKKLKVSSLNIHRFDFNTRDYLPIKAKPDSIYVIAKLSTSIDTLWTAGKPSLERHSSWQWSGNKDFPKIVFAFRPDMAKWMNILDKLLSGQDNPRKPYYLWLQANIFGNFCQEISLRDELAVGLWRKVTNIDENDALSVSAYINLSELYKDEDGERFYLKKAIEKFEKAGKDYKNAYKISDRSVYPPYVYFRWGCLLAEFNQKKEAIESLLKSLELSEDMFFIEDYFHGEEGGNTENPIISVWDKLKPYVIKRKQEISRINASANKKWKALLRTGEIYSDNDSLAEKPFYFAFIPEKEEITGKLSFQTRRANKKEKDIFYNEDIFNAYLFQKYSLDDKGSRKLLDIIDINFPGNFPTADLLLDEWLTRNRKIISYASFEKAKLSNDIQSVKYMVKKQILKKELDDESALFLFEMGQYLYKNNEKSLGRKALSRFIRKYMDTEELDTIYRKEIMIRFSACKKYTQKDKDLDLIFKNRK
ncbi:MAG: hypothetical protein JXA60_10470 [Candidatus Coatesbacteria bacterium]|nr:hypothetical protein [Candidatus Coatesbacteria bacterium]